MEESKNDIFDAEFGLATPAQMIIRLLNDMSKRFITKESSLENDSYRFRINYALTKLSDKQGIFSVDPDLKIAEHRVGAVQLDE